jgi:hypothetical protein
MGGISRSDLNLSAGLSEYLPENSIAQVVFNRQIGV